MLTIVDLLLIELQQKTFFNKAMRFYKDFNRRFDFILIELTRIISYIMICVSGISLDYAFLYL